ncbi:MAG: AmmeMemoRadiSam system protein A [Desulfamplus sp.]|nr:AmmeMemoRadiSam system protein A [Desulfamplus sp.]
MDNSKKTNRSVYSKKDGDKLLKLARSSIANKLGVNINLPKPSEIAAELQDDVFKNQLGTFVTLHLNKRLRGCIGTLESTQSVTEGIEQNAISAAFDDPRFPNLTPKEFNDIHLEVSILSKPLVLNYKNIDELLSKLEPGVHGVIIRKGGAKATFLPQVWQQLPDKSLFLSNLCRKAGLSEHEWKTGSLEVMTYTVEYFEE